MRLLVTRVARLLVIALIVSFFSYLLLEFVPGDPTAAVVGITATEEAREEARAELGLDKPLLQRYGTWLGNAASGDLGERSVTRTETTTLIRNALPKTLELAVLAQLIALGMAIPAAIYSARRPGKLLDRVTSAVSFGTLALPSFVLGVYLIALFSVRLDWLPALAGRTGIYVSCVLTLPEGVDAPRVRQALSQYSTKTAGLGRINDAANAGVLIVGDFAAIVATMRRVLDEMAIQRYEAQQRR